VTTTPATEPVTTTPATEPVTTTPATEPVTTTPPTTPTQTTPAGLTPEEQLAAAAASGPLVSPGEQPVVPGTTTPLPEPAPILFVTAAGAAPGYAIVMALPAPAAPDPLFISRGRVFDQHNIVRSSWDYRDVENYQVTYSSFDAEDKINDHPTGP
jgi:hypothetical protein